MIACDPVCMLCCDTVVYRFFVLLLCRGDIRLAQAEVFMSSLEAFLRERFGERYASVPVVLAGDLNNIPGVDVYRSCPLLDRVLPYAGRIACPCRTVLSYGALGMFLSLFSFVSQREARLAQGCGKLAKVFCLPTAHVP